ncbi:hypothetical protein ACB092_05G021800 [Castanea dentata]
MGNYLFLFIYMLFTFCFLLSVFPNFFFPAARTNPAKVVDKKQSALDATAIVGNYLQRRL